jgi:hypothetical protein
MHRTQFANANPNLMATVPRRRGLPSDFRHDKFDPSSARGRVANASCNANAIEHLDGQLACIAAAAGKRGISQGSQKALDFRSYSINEQALKKGTIIPAAGGHSNAHSGVRSRLD